MNVLLITNSDELRYARQALIPLMELGDYDLDAINGKDVNSKNLSDPHRDQILELFTRMGLVPAHIPGNRDFLKYLNPETPFTVHKVVMVSWGV